MARTIHPASSAQGIDCSRMCKVAGCFEIVLTAGNAYDTSLPNKRDDPTCHEIPLNGAESQHVVICSSAITDVQVPVVRMAAKSFSLAAGSCLDRAFNRRLRSRLSRTTLTAPVVSLAIPSSFSIAERLSQCSSCHMAVRRIRSSIFRSQDASSWKSTCSVRMLSELR